MKNKKANSEFESIVGLIVFVTLIIILIFGGVFSQIFNAFNTPVFGNWGFLLGGLFSLMIIVALMERLLGK